ncbi:protein FAM98C isoform 1-T1 [Synchiropus picturatus]
MEKRNKATLSAIKSLGYPGSRCVSRCECDELPCPLLTWLMLQLKTFCPELQDSAGIGDVLLGKELRQLLSHLHSPLSLATSEILDLPVLNRVTEFLVSELQAAQMLKCRELHPEVPATLDAAVKEKRVEDQNANVIDSTSSSNHTREAETQAEWILLLRALNMDASSKCTDVLQEVESRISTLPSQDMSEPLLKKELSAAQWMQLVKLNQALKDDYSCRQKMMVTRFQVTLESFAWGEKQKERCAALASAPRLASIAESSQVSVPRVLAAREDQSRIQPVRPGKSTAVYKKLMGHVPDRGGRPGEIEAPMPRWQENRASRAGRGGGHQQWRKSSDRKKGKKH